MTETLTDDERAFAEELHGNLTEIQEAVEASIPKVEEVLNGELPLDEYEEWVENNDDLLEQLHF